jgi:hypothetical protein
MDYLDCVWLFDLFPYSFLNTLYCPRPSVLTGPTLESLLRNVLE